MKCAICGELITKATSVYVLGEHSTVCSLEKNPLCLKIAQKRFRDSNIKEVKSETPYPNA